MVVRTHRADNAITAFFHEECFPVQRINHHPPELLSPAQRRQEIASLFALGLARLRQPAATPIKEKEKKSSVLLGFSADQSVHADTVNNPQTESQ